MKNLILIALAISLSVSSFSQREKVYSIVKQPQSVEWYSNQYKLWTTFLKKEPKNSPAWQNAYIALRMMKIYNAGKTQKDLDAFIEKMKKAIPETYEYHYLINYNGKNDESLYFHVEKAYKLNPKRTEVYPDLLTFNLLKNNKEKVKKYSEIWFNSNDYSPNILNFGYNILASCDDESVLITNGDNDTYPLIIVQNAQNFKKKVKVLNIYLLQKDAYREKIFEELKLKKFTKKLGDFDNQFDFMKAILKHLETNLEVPLYYSSTVNSKMYEHSKSKTYAVGLAMKFCEKNFDNIAVLKKNVEQNFKLDYLMGSFFNDISSSIVIRSNESYIVGFVTLYDHYKVSGEIQKQERIKKLIEKIAKTSRNSEFLLNYIK